MFSPSNPPQFLEWFVARSAQDASGSYMPGYRQVWRRANMRAWPKRWATSELANCASLAVDVNGISQEQLKCNGKAP
jgi:hypothetical protein